jgi:flagellar protein FlgJ
MTPGIPSSGAQGTRPDATLPAAPVEPAAVPSTGLKSGSGDTDTRLREVAAQFEAVFVRQLFAAMRATLPEGGAIDAGHAEDLFSQMLDEQVSELSAGRSGRGLADAIYRQLRRQVEP